MCLLMSWRLETEDPARGVERCPVEWRSYSYSATHFRGLQVRAPRICLAFGPLLARTKIMTGCLAPHRHRKRKITESNPSIYPSLCFSLQIDIENLKAHCLPPSDHHLKLSQQEKKHLRLNRRRLGEFRPGISSWNLRMDLAMAAWRASLPPTRALLNLLYSIEMKVHDAHLKVSLGRGNMDISGPA